MSSDRDRRHINVVLDRDLDKLVRGWAQASRISVSAVVRDALRWYFAAVDRPDGGGWREGYNAGYRAAQEAAKRAISQLPSVATAPDEPTLGRRPRALADGGE